MSHALTVTDHFRPAQVALIQRMNPDANRDEFDTFMHVSAQLGLDPLRKQVYCFVFNKDNPDRRRMAIVVGIDGFRSVAKRSGEYRPDNRATRFTYDESLADPESNPLGLVSAEVSVFQHSHGAWHEVTAVAYWEEFAPLIDSEWKDVDGKRRKIACKPKLDPNKDNWRRMPRVMLSKCAEAQAIRRAWPEDLSAVYADEELDRAKTLDLTATEIAEQANVQDRLEKIGGADGIMFDMGEGLTRLPLGKAADMIIAHLSKIEPHEVAQWANTNRVPLNEFWARSKSDALEVKKLVEKAAKVVEAQT